MTSSKSSASLPLDDFLSPAPRIVVHPPDVLQQERVLDTPITTTVENEAENEPDQNNDGNSHRLNLRHSFSYGRSRLFCLPIRSILTRSKNSKSLGNPQNIVPRKPVSFSGPSPEPSRAGSERTRPHPQVWGAALPSRPPANQYGLAPGSTERTFVVEGPPLKTSSLHVVTKPPRASNSERGEDSYKQATPESTWQASHTLSPLDSSSPLQTLFSPSNQSQETQELTPEQLTDPQTHLQRGACVSPRSVSQPHQTDFRKSTAELQSSQPHSLDSSPRSPRSRSVSLAVDRGGLLAAHQPLASNFPISPLHSEARNTSPEPTGRWRKSWLPGSRSRQVSQDISAQVNSPGAWYLGEPNREYNTQLLLNAQRVPELWHENGDTYVYLFPPASGRGPSFKIPSFSFSSSSRLMSLAFGEQKSRSRARSFEGRNTLSAGDATRKLSILSTRTASHRSRTSSHNTVLASDESLESSSSVGEGHLSFPFTQDELAGEDLEHFISVRNLFAFLTLQPLVSTRKHPTVFCILLEIAKHLTALGFSNVDGSTYGEAVSTSLQYYVENFSLADVRDSGEKALETVILGERLRSVDLYNEGFSHVVGRYESTREMSYSWNMVSANTHKRMELAYMDLRQRQDAVQRRLTEFEFPSVFAGTAASTSTAESKAVRFKAWRSSFFAIRKFTLSYYKDLHGSWPPKAKDKKNNFVESGLNRLVLQGLYRDFCMLYDLLVDRESLTTRSMEANDAIPEEEQNIAVIALRKVLSEFDHSSPPIQPPVPFDAPKLPTILTVQPNNDHYQPRLRTQNETRKLQPFECTLILTKSHNLDLDIKTPFLQAFSELEEKEGRGKSANDLVDQRFGFWIFVYVVLQSLPMLVIDAPGLRHIEGVEYFVCEPAKGGLPWMEESPSNRLAWYGIANGTGVVALPSDVVQHSVEGVYRRSHCWDIAEKWLAQGFGPQVEEERQDEHDGQSTMEGEESTQSTIPETQRVTSELEVRRPRRRSPAPELSVVTEEAQFSTKRQNTATSLHPQSAHPSHQRRSRTTSPSQRHRRSVAFPLEQLPLPPGYSMSFRNKPMPSPPIGAKFQSGHGRSEENTPTMLSPENALSVVSPKAKNFDEILSEMEKGKEKEKEKEKGRISFIGF